jgi:transcriptional regulator with XRE-family HTH domain
MSDMDVYRLLGSRAAKRRDELGLTQAEVASQIGLSRASLANLETGRQKILLHHVYKLAAALKVDSILDLIPKTFAFDTEPVNFVRSDVSDRQKAVIEDFVRRAGKRKL